MSFPEGLDPGDLAPAKAGGRGRGQFTFLPRCPAAPPYDGTFGSVLKIDVASELSRESLGAELCASPL